MLDRFPDGHVPRSEDLDFSGPRDWSTVRLLAIWFASAFLFLYFILKILLRFDL